MSKGADIPVSLHPRELEAVYAVSQVVIEAEATEAALDKIIRLARPVFIFDSIVLYTRNANGALEPGYVRVVGRGRFREADLAWGESIAQQVIQSEQTVFKVENDDTNLDRTDNRHFLGLPVRISTKSFGALVFIRFGGPIYQTDQIYLAEHFALHIAHLLEHQQLVEYIAKLEAKQRLDYFQEDFISTISHELLTPLGFVKGYATTLLREDTAWDESTRREFLTIIDEEADRLRELIDDLLDSSRLQSGTLSMNFQTVRLEAVLRDIALHARSRNENLNIEVKSRSAGLQVQADPARLAQVVNNIINNAMKYAPQSPVTISIERQNDRAVILIRDYGPGIPAEHLPLLFQRFYRIPGSSHTTRGTGLGLYICRKIIQAHNGEIAAESTLGEGTTFRIYLPCEQPG
jgi:signal transduction histidine kinase